MMNENNFLKEFREIKSTKLFELFKKKRLLDNELAEDVSYALYEISELIEKIYLKHIPKMLNESDLSKEKLEEIFDDIKFDFNEIRQLIETAKLTGLKYWDDDEK